MKKITAIFAIFLLLVLVGCKEEEQTTFSGKAFIGGTSGLDISFLSNLPPSEVFDTDNPFSISVKVENKGEYNIEREEDIDISISGIRPEDFGVSSSELSANSPEPLEGVRIDAEGNVVSGDYETVDFPEMKYASTVSGTLTFPIRANVCYEYGTNAQGQLCIRKDLRGVTGEASVCDPNREVPAENSGAPVQILNIRQNVAGSNKIDFFFTIRKVGAVADTLYKKGTNCDTALANRDIVYVDVQDTGLGTLTCSGLKDGTATSGYVTLFNNEREVRCSQTITSPEDIITPLKVSLTYGYKQFVDTQLKVKHAE